jgi:small subunit ribosomal protein S20
MANIASSKKDARRSAQRATANRAVRSSVKTKVAKFRRALAEGVEDAAELAVRAVAGLDRAAAKGVLHRNNAARRKSRLMKRLNAVAAGAPAAQKAPGKKSGASKSVASKSAATKSPAKAAPSKAPARAKAPAKPAAKTSRAAASKKKA